MANEKNHHPGCPQCRSNRTVKEGKRNGTERFKCLVCGKWFGINRRRPYFSSVEVLIDHLDGIPLRKIGFQKKVCAATILTRVRNELRLLPANAEVTRRYCGHFSGILVFDGKYLNVKGYAKGLVLLWGIDFLTHDIPHFFLAPSENYLAALNYFQKLRNLNYPLIYLVCDDNQAFKMAAKYVFPAVIIQTCLSHYKESMKRDLGIKSLLDTKLAEFYSSVESLFKRRLELVSFTRELVVIYAKFKDHPRCLAWIEDLMRRRKELLAYHQLLNVPNTTNLLEAYNSHLEARLKSLRGFQSPQSAVLWLNGYILRRRLKPFTDCTQPFKHLNGKCSLEKSLKRGLKLPQIFT